MPTAGPLLVTAYLAAILAAAGPAAKGRSRRIVVEGESPADTNIPTASDPAASGGRCLRLATTKAPPPGGWYAEYRVRVPAGGIYRLDAIVTSPAMADRDPRGGSWFDLSVN